MTWTEMKYDLRYVRAAIEDKLKEKYTHKDIDGILFFQTDSGVRFSLHIMGIKEPWNFMVISYEDSGEDGDGFYPEDYTSLDEMFAAMIVEIEDE